jgi:hypothetical protein
MGIGVATVSLKLREDVGGRGVQVRQGSRVQLAPTTLVLDRLDGQHRGEHDCGVILVADVHGDRLRWPRVISEMAVTQ